MSNFATSIQYSTGTSNQYNKARKKVQMEKKSQNCQMDRCTMIMEQRFRPTSIIK